MEEIRSVSMKMNPLRTCAVVSNGSDKGVGGIGVDAAAVRYSSMQCWDPNGFSGSRCQARVGRWDSGKRWMWESMIGMGIVGSVVVVVVSFHFGCFWSIYYACHLHVHRDSLYRQQ